MRPRAAEEDDKRPNLQHPAPRPIEELLRDPDVVTASGDPDAKTLAQRRAAQRERDEAEEKP